jgi:phospholipid N-methyltransferase
MRMSSEVGWANMGRTIADSGASVGVVAEAIRWRQREYQMADRSTQFAALMRQIADAAYAGRDYTQLVARLRELRKVELDG